MAGNRTAQRSDLCRNVLLMQKLDVAPTTGDGAICAIAEPVEQDRRWVLIYKASLNPTSDLKSDNTLLCKLTVAGT